MQRRRLALPLLLLAPACAPSGMAPSDGGHGPCASQGITPQSRFPGGSREGHPDPFGARRAKQARAARIKDPAWIRQPDDARHKIRVGDFVLANDKIAVYLEDLGLSDGYSEFGGEILAIEPVGDDGRPLGVSQYGETLLVLSKQAVRPESITVLADGSDGQAAIVRVSGQLANLPFLDTLSALFPLEYDLPAALDYVLAPGSEKLTIRLLLKNPKAQRQDLTSAQFFGFFQSSRSDLFTGDFGYGQPSGEVPWVAFDGRRSAFVYRHPGGKLRFFIDVSGFQLFGTSDLQVEACGETQVDYVEIIPGAPGLDGALAALRRVDGQPQRELAGKVTDSAGLPLAGALVHATATDGRYLSRATTGNDGSYRLHMPQGKAKLVATQRGYVVPSAVEAVEAAARLDLKVPANGTVVVRARDAKSREPLPVRIQVIPTATPAAAPGAWNVPSEERGRLTQEFAVTGEARLTVPPGEHEVVVSRGPEWEIDRRKVQVAAGQTVQVEANLLHSVDSAGVMCADFHIHSFYSADSADPVDYKVKGAIADGLEIPISSEHEWIIDFQPVIQRLGLGKWAFGLPSEEFTTFTWGHFGILPIQPRPEAVNNGAVQWIGKRPPEVFRAIAELPEQPVLIVNHPSGGGFGAYFSAVHFNRATAGGDAEMWSDQFGAVEVFNDSDFEANRSKVVADWFALLNAGKQVWAVGSSDSHSLRGSPVGYPRTCLRFGHDDPQRLTAEAVRDALRRGEAVVAGGLYLTVSGPGGVGPGGMVKGGGGGALPFTVVVQAPQWLEARSLEVIVDGESVQTVQLREQVGSPARRYEAQVMVSPKQPRPLHWVVFHASSSGRDLAPLHPGRRAFAVSNPVFF